jgi:hypothetical protein
MQLLPELTEFNVLGNTLRTSRIRLPETPAHTLGSPAYSMASAPGASKCAGHTVAWTL